MPRFLWDAKTGMQNVRYEVPIAVSRMLSSDMLVW
jgi:hypothetical protein